MNKNKAYFYIELLLVAFFSCQMITTIIGDVRFDHTYGDFNISDWLINYQGGFIRRGFIGEMLFQIYQLHPFSVKDVIIGMDIIAFICFAAVSVRAFIREKWSLLPLLFPLAVVDSGIVKYRRDFLILVLLYGLYVLYFKFYSNKKYLHLVLLEIVMVLSILIYEPTFFLFVPLLGIITYCNTPGSVGHRLMYCLGLFAAPIITMAAACLCKGDPNQAQLIWDSWQPLFAAYPEAGFDPEKIGLGVEFLGHGLKETILFHTEMLFGYPHLLAPESVLGNVLMVLLYCMIYLMVTRVPGVNLKQRQLTQNTHAATLSTLFIIQIVVMLPMLTALSCDIGRTIPYCMYTTFFLTYYLDKKGLAIRWPEIVHNGSEKIQGYMSRSRVLSSYPLYVLIFLLTPLGFTFAPLVSNTILYQWIIKLIS